MPRVVPPDRPARADCRTPASSRPGVEQLPAELAGLASLVTVHFPWGSLLRAAVGEDADGAAGIARLVAPGGRLRLLVSAAERDANGGGVVDLDPGAVVGAYRELGMELVRVPAGIGRRPGGRALDLGTATAVVRPRAPNVADRAGRRIGLESGHGARGVP